MNNTKISVQIADYQKHFGEFLTVEQVAFIVGIKPRIIKYIITHEIIKIEDNSIQPTIHVKCIPRLKKVVRLHYDLGIGWNSMGIILDLLDRIDELESAGRIGDWTCPPKPLR